MLNIYQAPGVQDIIFAAQSEISNIMGKDIQLIPQEVLTKLPERTLQERDIKLRSIICDACDVTWQQLTSKRRDRRFVLARQLYCVYARNLFKFSLKHIGFIIGERDHTTVIHSCQTINDLVAVEDIAVMEKMNQINLNIFSIYEA